MKKVIYLLLCFIFLMPSVSAGRGCCSHHGGVSHCGSNGRYVCNDGWTGSSCGCYYVKPNVYGCTDINAKNYNSNANINDGSCQYYKYGCTNVDSINYDEYAEKDDGSCIRKKYGCMDQNAYNYDDSANIDSNCLYKETKSEEELIKYNIDIYEKSFFHKVPNPQKGENGLKKVTYNIFKDKNGIIKSKNKISEVIIKPVTDEIIIENNKIMIEVLIVIVITLYFLIKLIYTKIYKK